MEQTEEIKSEAYMLKQKINESAKRYMEKAINIDEYNAEVEKYYSEMSIRIGKEKSLDVCVALSQLL